LVVDCIDIDATVPKPMLRGSESCNHTERCNIHAEEISLPFHEGNLLVDVGHQLYLAEYGQAAGLAALVLYGGRRERMPAGPGLPHLVNR
jgi:hypothetical protein